MTALFKESLITSSLFFKIIVCFYYQGKQIECVTIDLHLNWYEYVLENKEKRIFYILYNCANIDVMYD